MFFSTPQTMDDLSFTPFPTIVTERLVLRQIVRSDDEDLFRIRSNKSIMKYIDRPLAVTLEDVHTLIDVIDRSLAGNNGITWAVTLKEDLKLIGTIGYWRLIKEHFRAEIGYSLHSDFQRQGIMQEAFGPVMNYGFYNMKLNSVEANVNPNNQASIQPLEKNHFEKEAHFKENYYYNGKFLDSVIYCLIKSNYKKL